MLANIIVPLSFGDGVNYCWAISAKLPQILLNMVGITIPDAAS